MKKSIPLIILMGTVAFYTNLAFAAPPVADQSTDDQSADQKTANQNSTTDDSQLSAIQKEIKAEQTQTAAKKDSTQKDAGTISAQSLSLTTDEFKTYKVNFKFDGTAIVAYQADGAAPLSQICIKHLSMQVPATKPSADDGSVIQNEDDLKAHSTSYKPSVSFLGDGTINSLADCEKQTKDSQTGDLSSLSKDVLDHDSDWAYISTGDTKSSDDSKDSGMFSAGYYNLKNKHLAKKDCATCNADPASLDTRIKDLLAMKSPAVQDLIDKDEEAKLAILDDRAKSVKSQAEAEKVVADLLAEATRIDGSKMSQDMKQNLIANNIHDSLTVSLANQLVSVGSKATTRDPDSQELVSDDKKQSALTVYIGTLFKSALTLPHLDDDTISADKSQMASHVPGTKAKPNLGYLKNEMLMNENHSDLAAAKQGMIDTEAKLKNQYLQICQPQANGLNNGTTQCMGAIQTLLSYDKQKTALDSSLQTIVAKQQLSDMMDTTDIFGSANSPWNSPIGSLATQNQTVLNNNGNVVNAYTNQNQNLAGNIAPNVPITKYIETNPGVALFSSLQSNQAAVPPRSILMNGGATNTTNTNNVTYAVPVYQPLASQS